MTYLELLAPARNLECGKAAVDHGADAVYIGADHFGARAAAGNNVDDIAELCRYAHRYGVKVYVTVNTIVYDDELGVTRRLIERLEKAGVDAVIVQDMAVRSMVGRMALHASTQTDNRTADKVRWLRDAGFSRVVLARELSAAEIADIHAAVPDVELEVFVHGALCVSYSGLCYASQACFGRSANRGECAQFCRLKFDLIDADGRTVERGRHFLSLKDMNRSERLEQLVEAGATSFKIEGRLKDVAYVKNVTAAYSDKLDAIIRRHPDLYRRASLGHCRYTFVPNLSKTFNRGFTDYFLDGRRSDMSSMDSPKAIGEYVGVVKEIRGNSFSVAGIASFANGDGLCFLNADRQLEGFRVNKAEGNRLFPQKMPRLLRSGTRIYRNSDKEFDDLLARPSAERKIPLKMSLGLTSRGFCLTAELPDGRTAAASIETEHQLALKSQRDNIVRQITKLGNTPYECDDVDMPADFSYFIPSSLLTALRRQVVEQLESEEPRDAVAKSSLSEASSGRPPGYGHSCFYNISNEVARRFYSDSGLAHADRAFELQQKDGVPLMQCRYCLRHALGFCVRHGGKRSTWREPLYLQIADGRRFRLEFDCKNCQMSLYNAGASAGGRSGADGSGNGAG